MAEMKVTMFPAMRKSKNRNAPKNVKKTRVAAYCRVSTENEEQESSYEVQVEYFFRIYKCTERLGTCRNLCR